MEVKDEGGLEVALAGEAKIPNIFAEKEKKIYSWNDSVFMCLNTDKSYSWNDNIKELWWRSPKYRYGHGHDTDTDTSTLLIIWKKYT